MQDGLLLDGDGEIDLPSFELAMRHQLADYTQRLLANKMQQAVRGENENAPVLFAMKMAVMEIMAAASERRQVAILQQDENRKLDAMLERDAGQVQQEASTGADGYGESLGQLASAVGVLNGRVEEMAGMLLQQRLEMREMNAALHRLEMREPKNFNSDRAREGSKSDLSMNPTMPVGAKPVTKHVGVKRESDDHLDELFQ